MNAQRILVVVAIMVLGIWAVHGAAQTEGQVSSAASDQVLQQLDTKLSRILTTQQDIMTRLDAVQQDLIAIKQRVSRNR